MGRLGSTHPLWQCAQDTWQWRGRGGQGQVIGSGPGEGGISSTGTWQILSPIPGLIGQHGSKGLAPVIQLIRIQVDPLSRPEFVFCQSGSIVQGPRDQKFNLAALHLHVCAWITRLGADFWWSLHSHFKSEHMVDFLSSFWLDTYAFLKNWPWILQHSMDPCWWCSLNVWYGVGASQKLLRIPGFCSNKSELLRGFFLHCKH